MEVPGVCRCGYPHGSQAVPVLELASRSATIPGMKGLRILIVDDHAGFRASARRMLELEGFRVVGEAATGAEAVAAVREHVPDIALVDVGLPDCDGRDLARELNGDPRLEVLLISSRDDIESGIDQLGFIPKDRLSGPAIVELLP
jgi:DNA-binding NarL/FixJ family response regulator